MSGREFWGLIAPWLGHVVLAAVAILGLFTASGAPDEATYDVGLATFAVALIVIAVRLKRQLDGGDVPFLLAVTITNSDELCVTIFLLGILGLVGGVLAATVGGIVYPLGLALFVVCYALILYEIKHFFDRRDRGA